MEFITSVHGARILFLQLRPIAVWINHIDAS